MAPVLARRAATRMNTAPPPPPLPPLLAFYHAPLAARIRRCSIPASNKRVEHGEVLAPPPPPPLINTQTCAALADQLSELALQLIQSSPKAAQAQGRASVKSAQGNSSELTALLCTMVPFRDLARLVDRLRRPSSGLCSEWRIFCNSHGEQHFDMFQIRPILLLKFLCWAIACEPRQVLALCGDKYCLCAKASSKERLKPFMVAVLQLSKGQIARVIPAELAEPVHNHSRQDVDLPAPNAKLDNTCEQFKGLLGVSPPPPIIKIAPDIKHFLDHCISVRTEHLQPVVLDDSTIAGSFTSNSDRSETGDSDRELHMPDSVHTAIGCTFSEERGTCIPQYQAPSSAMLWLGPACPDPIDVPMTKLAWQ